MKSKKVRRVILRTPKVKRVRNNLRVLLKLAIKDELSRLGKVKRLYLNKSFKNDLTPSQQRRYNRVSRKYKNLYFSFIESTLRCGCGAGCRSYQDAKKSGFNPQDRPTGLDLVWVPWLKK